MENKFAATLLVLHGQNVLQMVLHFRRRPQELRADLFQCPFGQQKLNELKDLFPLLLGQRTAQARLHSTRDLLKMSIEARVGEFVGQALEAAGCKKPRQIDFRGTLADVLSLIPMKLLSLQPRSQASLRKIALDAVDFVLQEKKQANDLADSFPSAPTSWNEQSQEPVEPAAVPLPTPSRKTTRAKGRKRAVRRKAKP